MAQPHNPSTLTILIRIRSLPTELRIVIGTKLIELWIDNLPTKTNNELANAILANRHPFPALHSLALNSYIFHGEVIRVFPSAFDKLAATDPLGRAYRSNSWRQGVAIRRHGEAVERLKQMGAALQFIGMIRWWKGLIDDDIDWRVFEASLPQLKKVYREARADGSIQTREMARERVEKVFRDEREKYAKERRVVRVVGLETKRL